jgi:hypothetical protein
MTKLSRISALGLVLAATLLAACSKPLLYGNLQETEEIVKTYQVPPAEAFRAAKEALLFKGYSLKQEDPTNFILETYWQPSTADSHYVNVFGRKDFGTVGSYYRLVVKITPKGNGSRVGISNVAKSFISNLKSSQQEEDKIFEKISDFTRKQDIQVTNIGLQ